MTEQNRLIATLDDLRERMVRIEEGIKPIADIKKDVDVLKVEIPKIEASASSAHKRMDGIDKDLKEIPKIYTTSKEHTEHDKRIAKVERVINWVAGIIIAAVIMAVLGLVLINQ